MNISSDEPTIPGPVENPVKPNYVLPSNSCDTHAHVFGPIKEYPYVVGKEYIPPDASLEHYAGLLEFLGFSRAVLVQPSVYGLDNSRMLDALRSTFSNDFGIQWRGISVIDKNATDNQLEEMNELGVRGIRINLVFAGAQDVFNDLKSLAERIKPFGWHIQLLVDISKLKDIGRVFGDLQVPVVFDHMGHFDASLGVKNAEFQNLLSLMRENLAWAKLSGPNRISKYNMAPFDDVLPIAQELLKNVPENLVFGSDWPHVKLPTDIPDDGALINELHRWVSGDNHLLEQVLVNNPARLYGF